MEELNDNTFMNIIGVCIAVGMMVFIGIVIFLSVLESNGVDTTLLKNQILITIIVILSIPLIILAIQNKKGQTKVSGEKQNTK